MQLRVLPILIATAILTLGLRVGEIWTGFGNLAEARSEVEAGAEIAPGDPFARLQRAQVAEVSDGPDGDEATEEDLLARVNDEGEGAGEPVGPGAGSRDPFAMSEEEIELLQQLVERRETLERRARALDQREAIVQAAEKRLEEKVADLEALKETIEDLLIEYDEEQNRQLERLVNIYERMEPQDAARIFEDLEMPILLKVVDRMNERRTAPILAHMQPEKAQALTLELAERRELPIPRN